MNGRCLLNDISFLLLVVYKRTRKGRQGCVVVTLVVKSLGVIPFEDSNRIAVPEKQFIHAEKKRVRRYEGRKCCRSRASRTPSQKFHLLI